MSLYGLQKQVHDFTKQFNPQYWPPHEILARLSEEVGELAREVNHLWGTKKKKATEDKAELADEMADIFFTLCCLANSQDIDLDKSFNKMMDKCWGRDKDRFEKKEE